MNINEVILSMQKDGFEVDSQTIMVLASVEKRKLLKLVGKKLQDDVLVKKVAYEIEKQSKPEMSFDDYELLLATGERKIKAVSLVLALIEFDISYSTKEELRELIIGYTNVIAYVVRLLEPKCNIKEVIKEILASIYVACEGDLKSLFDEISKIYA